jgi:hypothetical protein
MPCIKCANGKYKYGEHGNCQFDTLTACKAAAAAIHINNPNAKEDSMDNKKPKKKPLGPHGINVVQPGPHGPMPETAPSGTVAAAMSPSQTANSYHDTMCQCASCMKGAMTPYKY